MNTGKRGSILLVALLIATTWIGCSSDRQLTGPAGSAQVSLNISFAQSAAKQHFDDNIHNATQIIREVTVSVLETGNDAVVVKEQQLEINSTPQGRFAEGELSIPVREDGQPFAIVVYASDPDNLLFFVGTANVTLDPGETGERVDITLRLATSIASSGTVTASSTFQAGFEPQRAVDFNTGTSWFSGDASTDGNPSFTWTAQQQVFLGTIGIFNNMSHNNPTYQSGYGFQTVTFQVYNGPNASGTPVYQETVAYPEIFPVVRVSPFVSGQTIKLLFDNHENQSGGGFSELLIVPLDFSGGPPPKFLASIAINPPNPDINVGQTRQFNATGAFTDGSTDDLTDDVTWMSSNTAVATITTSGLATGLTAGITTITAAQGNISNQTTLTVNSASLSGATLSNLQVPLVQLNDATNCTLPDQRIASLFDVVFNYTDPDGDVTTGTTANITFTFSPSNSAGSFSVTNPGITGNGSQGTISFGACFVFADDTSVRVTVSITDAGNRVSNATSVEIQKPTGANSPPDGARIGYEFLPQISVCSPGSK